MNTPKISKLLPLLILLAFANTLTLRAAHIIGGDITYECKGSGKYEFTMKIYRDCQGGGAPFDAPGGQINATVTIYKGNSTVPFDVINLGAPDITQVLPNLSNPCLIAPTNVCVEEGVYVFDLDLPVSSESYYIIYQRCCRNNSITNIVAPGESGATYFMELTPAAQQACNSSPVFNDFPPIVICEGEPINFDHSATDPDGHTLEYHLFNPFLGGGTDQQNATQPLGVAPDPDMPPPFGLVTFVSPLYTWQNPLGSNPPLKIDPVTGFLTGTPAILGQFVVGVEVIEKDASGTILSRVRRDFQFNVTQCDPTVVADVAEDSMVIEQGEQYFVVQVCGPGDVVFTIQSFQQQFIDFRQWTFSIDSNLVSSNEWNGEINFPHIGTFYGSLVLNPNTSCGDTAWLRVDVFPDIRADFEYEYDTCRAGPVSFTDFSVSDAGPNTIEAWNWDFGDGGSSAQQHPTHIYQVPGELPISLTVRDTNNCTDTKTKAIPYFPVPELLVISPSEFIGCQPATIFFDNLSFPVDESYTVAWDFGDGGTSGEISPSHLFTELGTFSISLKITSPLGCETDTAWNDLITILPSPTAAFSYLPEQPSNLDPTIHFTDESMDAAKWKWTFGTAGGSTQQNPVFTFPDTGLQQIQLVVFHASGCPDTAIQTLDVIPEVRYFLPNAFTPNGDGVNDGFRGTGSMEGATNFSLTIWNRYGEQLFETTDPDELWNGKKNNTGNVAPQGVYVVVVNFRGPRGEKHELRGYATLVK